MDSSLPSAVLEAQHDHTPTFERCLMHLKEEGADTAKAHQICYSTCAGGECARTGMKMESALREATKAEQGYDWNARHFLYVPDPELPSTWKLRVYEIVDGKPEVTQAQLGRAAAALTHGFRGQKVDIPADAIARAKGKLRGMYRSHGWDIPEALAESKAPMPESATPGGQLMDLFEAALAGAQVDREKRLVKGVVLVGPESPTRKRRYPRETLERARDLYGGTQIFIDHPAPGKEGEERSAWDLAGRVQKGSVRVDESGRLRGDVKCNRLRGGEAFLNLAEDDPESAGMSHNAVGAETDPDPAGWKAVTSISEARSVDLVTRPGTTRGFFESASSGQGAGMELKDVTLEQLVVSRKDLVEEIRELGREEIRGKDLKEAKASLAAAQTELTETKKRAAAIEGARVVDKVLGEHTELPESVRKRIRGAMLKETDLTEAKVEAAIQETVLFFKESGFELKAKAASTPATVVNQAVPTGDRGVTGSDKTLKETAALFGKLLGYDEPKPAAKPN